MYLINIIKIQWNNYVHLTASTLIILILGIKYQIANCKLFCCQDLWAPLMEFLTEIQLEWHRNIRNRKIGRIPVYLCMLGSCLVQLFGSEGPNHAVCHNDDDDYDEHLPIAHLGPRPSPNHFRTTFPAISINSQCPSSFQTSSISPITCYQLLSTILNREVPNGDGPMKKHFSKVFRHTYSKFWKHRKGPLGILRWFLQPIPCWKYLGCYRKGNFRKTGNTTNINKFASPYLLFGKNKNKCGFHYTAPTPF